MPQLASPNTLISVNGLSWSAGRQKVLDNIGFELPEGSFTGLIGANGAGKSTLLRCLYRYLKPDAGNIAFQGHDIWQMSANDYARRTAVVLQEQPPLFNLSVYEVVSLGLIPHQSLFASTRDSDKQGVRAAIEQVGLSHRCTSAFEHLSGGEKQRALIAKAMVQKPQLLMMDEPTSHLDVKYQIQIMALARDLGSSVIASFHDLNLAIAMCDNLLVLHQGKLVAAGAPADIITEQLLSDAFGVCTRISQHPDHGGPHITYYYGQQNHQPLNRKGQAHG